MAWASLSPNTASCPNIRRGRCMLKESRFVVSFSSWISVSLPRVSQGLDTGFAFFFLLAFPPAALVPPDSS